MFLQKNAILTEQRNNRVPEVTPNTGGWSADKDDWPCVDTYLSMPLQTKTTGLCRYIPLDAPEAGGAVSGGHEKTTAPGSVHMQPHPVLLTDIWIVEKTNIIVKLM